MTSSAPAVAVIGANGYVGKMVMPFLFEALQQKRIKELRILSRKFDENALKGLIAKGATTQNASYHNIPSLTQALAGIDVVINMMGFQGDDFAKNKEALLQAMTGAGVKVYIPSEFGTNHYITNYPDNKTFAPKAHHLEEAKARIPKVCAIFTSLMMEMAFFKGLGFDNEKEVWNIVGDGDALVSLTATEDVGHFTTEAAIMAYHQPDKVPERVIISTVTKTFQEYAAIFDKYSTTGNKIKIVGKPLKDAKEEWEVTKHSIPVGMIGPLLLIMMAEGHFDHTIDSTNELLNPGESKWKLKSFEEYAKEQKGRPWVGKGPFDDLFARNLKK